VWERRQGRDGGLRQRRLEGRMRAAVKLEDVFIRANYAEILLQLVQEKRIESPRVLRRARLPAHLLADPEGYLSLAQFERLVRVSLEETGDAALGLHFGERLKFTTHGPLSQAAVSCATIREALELLIKYYRIRFASLDLQFFIDGRDAVIALDERLGLSDLKPFLVEALFVSVMDVNALLFGTRLLIGGSCRISYPEPAYGEEYRRYFHDAITFDTGVNELRFLEENLDLPLALANPVTKRLAEQKCEAELASLQARESILARVRRILENADDRLPGMDEVADRLFMSSRTLRRQMQAQGMRFHDLMADVRLARAKRLLLSGSQGIDDIAHRLGYSDPSNFGRAFRKWTGLSPSAFREQSR